MYSLYSAHVMSCHCCMFTDHYHFNILGIEWDRIYHHNSHLWSSQARPRQLTGPFFIHAIKTPTKWSCDCCNSTLSWKQGGCSGAWNLSKLLSFTYISNYANSQLAWGTNQTVDFFKSFTTWSSKVFYIKLITNILTSIVVPCVHLSQTTLPL